MTYKKKGIIMKCPACENTNLLMTERQGVEIDYCPECRGVWLDRGELDKIIEKSNSENNSNQHTEKRESQSDNRNYEKHNDHSDNYSNDHDRKKKKGGFMGDLLDF